MKPTRDKMFIVRKYIKATSAAEAIRKERKEPVHDVFIDDDWRKTQHDQLAPAIGFNVQSEEHD